MRFLTLFLSLTFAGCMFFRPQKEPAEFPVPDEVSDHYHGEKIRDPFRWLEEPYAPEVQQWISDQNSKQERYLKTKDDSPALSASRRLYPAVHGHGCQHRAFDRYL